MTPQNRKPDSQSRESEKALKRARHGHEIGVGSTTYEGKEILGAKPAVPPWDEEYARIGDEEEPPAKETQAESRSKSKET